MQSTPQSSTFVMKALNQQIESLMPIRSAYQNLQRYFIKITHDFETLLCSQNEFSYDFSAKVRQLQLINQQLEAQYSRHMEELRHLEMDKAKCVLMRNSLIANGEALKSKAQLEVRQGLELQKKVEESAQNGAKLQYNIQKYRQLIQNLEYSIRDKQSQNRHIQGQICKIEEFNSQFSQVNQQFQQNIQQLNSKNAKLIAQSRQLDSKIETYDQLIENKQKANKQSLQLYIKQTEQLETLKHRMNYVEHLLQNELEVNRQLNKSQLHYQSILERQSKQLQQVSKQNASVCETISSQHQQIESNISEKSRLKEHLFGLIQTNEILYRELQKSCIQDKKIQRILTDKMQKLVIAGDKVVETQAFMKIDYNSIERGASPKRTVKRFEDKFEDRMRSTWNSSEVKENISN